MGQFDLGNVLFLLLSLDVSVNKMHSNFFSVVSNTTKNVKQVSVMRYNGE